MGDMIEKESSDQNSWATALCCVYTHVRVSSVVSKPKMTLYNGSSYTIKKNTMTEAAAEAMSDICKMSMGEKDCETKEKCVEEAFEQSSCEDPHPSARFWTGRYRRKDGRKKPRNQSCMWLSNKKRMGKTVLVDTLCSKTKKPGTRRTAKVLCTGTCNPSC